MCLSGVTCSSRRGFVQVIGHTPPEKLARGHDVEPSVALEPQEVGGAALASRGLYLVDPSVQWTIPDDGRAPAVRYKGPPSPGRYRYAVISSGRITAHESETSRVTRTRAR